MAGYDWLLFGKADGDLPEPSSLYGYTPTTTVCVAFIVLFGISAGEPTLPLCSVLPSDSVITVIHGCQAVAWKLWLFLAMPCLCCILEVAGWLGRFWSSFAPADLTPYTIQ